MLKPGSHEALQIGMNVQMRYIVITRIGMTKIIRWRVT